MCGKFAVATTAGVVVAGLGAAEGVVVEVDYVAVTLGAVFVLEVLLSDGLVVVFDVATFAGLGVVSLSVSRPNDHLAAENIPNSRPPTTTIPSTVMTRAVGRETALVDFT